MANYVITKNKKGKYHFTLQTSPGNDLVSSQMYMARKGSMKGIKAIGLHAPKASVQDDTSKEIVKLPIPKFELYKGKDGKFYFEFIANNGKAVCTSKAFVSAAKAKEGIKLVKKYANAKYNKYTINI